RGALFARKRGWDKKWEEYQRKKEQLQEGIQQMRDAGEQGIQQAQQYQQQYSQQAQQYYGGSPAFWAGYEGRV
ncbi:MAG: hypothetical protein ACYTGV_11915, partial [Planctomycetota bacterium]